VGLFGCVSWGYRWSGYGCGITGTYCRMVNGFVGELHVRKSNDAPR
jgi:hypothetical protein